MHCKFLAWWIPSMVDYVWIKDKLYWYKNENNKALDIDNNYAISVTDTVALRYHIIRCLPRHFHCHHTFWQSDRLRWRLPSGCREIRCGSSSLRRGMRRENRWNKGAYSVIVVTFKFYFLYSTSKLFRLQKTLRILYISFVI